VQGKLQRCLGWELVKRLEDDAKEYNQLQEAAQAVDDQLEAQKAAMPGDADPESEHVDILGGGAPAQLYDPHQAVDPSAAPSQGGSPGGGVDARNRAARAAANPHLTLREEPRFSLFSRSTTIFEHASCPYAPPLPPPSEGVPPGEAPQGGLRYFHQTCLQRGEHLRHYRRVLHWSGSSNINPKKKNSGRRDMVKVTGRTALCHDCLSAFAHDIGADPSEMLPKETDPERRQRKVSSRRRLALAKEHPVLEPSDNCSHTVSITGGTRFKEEQSSNFAALRKAVPSINNACEALELAVRGYLTENAAEFERRAKRQCTEFDIPLPMDGGAPTHHADSTANGGSLGASSDPNLTGELHMGDAKFEHALQHDLLPDQPDPADALDANSLQQQLHQAADFGDQQPEHEQQH